MIRGISIYLLVFVFSPIISDLYSSGSFDQPICLDVDEHSPSIQQEFFRAIETGNWQQMHEFLRAGANPLICNDEGLTPFLIAASRGHGHLVQWLAGYPPLIPTTNPLGQNAFHLAAYNGHLHIIQWLAEHIPAFIDTTDSTGSTALHYAAQQGHEEIVQYLAISYPRLIPVENKNFETAFLAASRCGHTMIAQNIANWQGRINGSVAGRQLSSDHSMHGSTPPSVKRGKKRRPYIQDVQDEDPRAKKQKTRHIPSRYTVENLALIKEWLKSGLEINQVDSQGWTLLHHAAHKGKIDIVMFLLSLPEIEIEALTKPLKTALNLAAEGNHSKVVAMLIERGADPNRRTKVQVGRPEKSLLIQVVTQGLIDVVQVLLRSPRINTEVIDGRGRTPLHIACDNGAHEIITMLLAANARVDAVDKGRWTALHHAARWNHPQAITILLNAHADVHALTRFEYTPLLIAIQHNAVNAAQILLPYGPGNSIDHPMHLAAISGKEILTFLLTSGADINVLAHGLTPLHRAVIAGNEEMCTYLLKNGANPNSQAVSFDYEIFVRQHPFLHDIVPIPEAIGGFTPLHYAVLLNKPFLAQLLLMHGADPKKVAATGARAIAIAVENGRKGATKIWNDVMTVLLNYDASALICTDMDGSTPLHLMAAAANLELLLIMLKYDRSALRMANNVGELPHQCVLKDKGNPIGEADYCEVSQLMEKHGLNERRGSHWTANSLSKPLCDDFYYGAYPHRCPLTEMSRAHFSVRKELFELAVGRSRCTLCSSNKNAFESYFVLKFLSNIESYADNNKWLERSPHKVTCLMWAAFFNEANFIANFAARKLLTPAFVHAQDRSGKTALDYAAQAGNGYIISTHFLGYARYNDKFNTEVLLRTAELAAQESRHILATSLIFTILHNLKTLIFY